MKLGCLFFAYHPVYLGENAAALPSCQVRNSPTIPLAKLMVQLVAVAIVGHGYAPL